MGFGTLKNWMCSDNAADAHCAIEDAMMRELIAQYRKTKEENEWNTPGAVNVALLIESGIMNGVHDVEEYGTFFKGVLKELKSFVDPLSKNCWGEEHHKHIKRMTKALIKFCKRRDLKL